MNKRVSHIKVLIENIFFFHGKAFEFQAHKRASDRTWEYSVSWEMLMGVCIM